MEQLGEDPIHVPMHSFPYTNVSQVGVNLAGSLFIPKSACVLLQGGMA